MTSVARLTMIAGLGLACALGGACGGAGAEVDAALQRGEIDLALRLYDAEGGRDLGPLRAIAQSALEREARSADPQRRTPAFAALRQAGTAAAPVLERLAGASDASVRLRALSLQALLGDAAARGALRELTSAPDAEEQAAAVAVLDPESAEDLRRLCELLDSPSAQVRAAAVAQLAHAPADAATVGVLARSARVDPELGVRLAAVRALAKQGEPGARAIAERLEDADPELRAAAAAALAFADAAFARERLMGLLTAQPTPAGIEAARALLSVDRQAAPAAARDQLARALGHPDAALRGRAAVALMSLRDPTFAPVIAARAPREPSRGIKLCLALALAPGEPARKPLLQALVTDGDTVSAQAAAELALGGDAQALSALRRLLRAKDAHVRGVVVRALGGELRRTLEIRDALRDRDARVRIAAASTILSARVQA